jgi:hypothetical protein
MWSTRAPRSASAAPCRHRAAEQEALNRVAPQAGQFRELFWTLHAFGDDHGTGPVGQVEHCGDQYGARARPTERRDEAAVDLDDVWRHLLQPGEGRIPDTEVVEGQTYPEPAQCLQRGDRCRRVGVETLLGHLQDELVR